MPEIIISNEMKKAFSQFRLSAPILIALVDEARQKIIEKLAEAGEEGVNVTDLSDGSELSRPAISHHLKVLKDAGLVATRKQGTQVFYRLQLSSKMERLVGLKNAVETLINKANRESKKTEEE
jgi:ArsR family transcriptional regulator